MNVIKSILKFIIIGAFFIFAILTSIIMLNTNEYKVPEFMGKSYVALQDEVSSTKYNEGDVVVIEERSLADITVGDEIFTYKVEGGGKSSIQLGNVGEIHDAENAISFDNGSLYSEKFIIGEAVEVYSGMGLYLSLVQNTWVFFFIVVVPCFLIFIYQIYALIIEIKYGDEEKQKPKSQSLF